MKRYQWLLIGGLMLAGLIQASGQPPPTSPAPPVTLVSPSTPTQPAENLILTGLAHIGSLKCAFLQVEQAGQPIRYYTLKEGEQKGAIQLLAVDAARSQVTLRHHGLIQQLKIRDVRPLSLDSERHKDLAHSQHHTLRARLEREQDERAAAEPNSEAVPNPIRDDRK